MSLAFDTMLAPGVVFRVGRKPDVWQWTDWRFAGFDGTFGGRWDDPQGRYRMLYGSIGRLGAYVEVLADFRPDLELVVVLREIVENDEEAPVTVLAGRVPAGWQAGRLLGTGITDGVKTALVLVAGTLSLSTLRSHLAPLILECGVGDLDAATIRLAVPRAFTQRLSRFIYEQVQEDGSPYGGLRYLSRFGDDLANCGFFERGGHSPVAHLERMDIELDDPDYLHACKLLGLQPE